MKPTVWVFQHNFQLKKGQARQGIQHLNKVFQQCVCPGIPSKNLQNLYSKIPDAILQTLRTGPHWTILEIWGPQKMGSFSAFYSQEMRHINSFGKPKTGGFWVGGKKLMLKKFMFFSCALLKVRANNRKSTLCKCEQKTESQHCAN